MFWPFKCTAATHHKLGKTLLIDKFLVTKIKQNQKKNNEEQKLSCFPTFLPQKRFKLINIAQESTKVHIQCMLKWYSWRLHTSCLSVGYLSLYLSKTISYIGNMLCFYVVFPRTSYDSSLIFDLNQIDWFLCHIFLYLIEFHQNRHSVPPWKINFFQKS